jgi:hypothetical protein
MLPATAPMSTGRSYDLSNTTVSVATSAAAWTLTMRATFITTALENGAQLEDVQKAAGHRDPSTTKLYDRRGYNPEKAASFFAADLARTLPVMLDAATAEQRNVIVRPHGPGVIFLQLDDLAADKLPALRPATY